MIHVHSTVYFIDGMIRRRSEKDFEKHKLYKELETLKLHIETLNQDPDLYCSSDWTAYLCYLREGLVLWAKRFLLHCMQPSVVKANSSWYRTRHILSSTQLEVPALSKRGGKRLRCCRNTQCKEIQSLQVSAYRKEQDESPCPESCHVLIKILVGFIESQSMLKQAQDALSWNEWLELKNVTPKSNVSDMGWKMNSLINRFITITRPTPVRILTRNRPLVNLEDSKSDHVLPALSQEPTPSSLTVDTNIQDEKVLRKRKKITPHPFPLLKKSKNKTTTHEMEKCQSLLEKQEDNGPKVTTTRVQENSSAKAKVLYDHAEIGQHKRKKCQNLKLKLECNPEESRDAAAHARFILHVLDSDCNGEASFEELAKNVRKYAAASGTTSWETKKFVTCQDPARIIQHYFYKLGITKDWSYILRKSDHAETCAACIKCFSLS